LAVLGLASVTDFHLWSESYICQVVILVDIRF
jgi:hypothetical protein